VSDTNLVEEPAELAATTRKGDLTSGPILRTLILFAIPTFFSNLLQTAGGTFNSIWVGQLLGEGALAATANANMIVFLASAAVFGFGSSTTVRVAQYFGSGNVDGARRTFGTGLGFCAASAIGGGLLGWVFADPLLRVLATPPAIHDDALIYLRISFLTMPFSTISLIISMGLRGAGDAKTSLYAMILTTILGVAINPLLILGLGPFPRLGIGGSALALLVANVIGCAAMVTWCYLRDVPLRLKGAELAYLLPLREELGFVVTKGLPMGAQMLVSSSAALVMIGFVNREGTMTTAAYSAVILIWNYAQMPAISISMAVSAMAAQSVGASLHDRVDRVTRAGLLACFASTVLLTLVLLALNEPLMAMFLGHASPAIPIGEHIQYLAIWSWPIMSLMLCLVGTMRAYGVAFLPLVIMAVAHYPVRIGFYELLRPSLGADALWLSYPVGSAVALAMTWLAFVRPGWRKDQFPSAHVAERIEQPA
jgi:putative MATE family efflux protein